MVAGVFIHEPVNFQCAHAGTDFLCHEIEYARIDDTALADTFYLFGSLDKVACWA